MSTRHVVICDGCGNEHRFSDLAMWLRIAMPGELVGTQQVDLCSEACLVLWLRAEADRRAPHGSWPWGTTTEPSRAFGTVTPYETLLGAVRACDCLDPTREEANEDSAVPYCFECEQPWPCSGERLRVLAGWTGRHPEDAS